ncbi:peptide chain release factor N(5)-glutamine methyltransferase [Algoriphagus confluentis]|uniref:Release factor glutamine methyltransferase n=1 Tax=Algoriphagus confluentis TaxID=1697556 RepID=A0ABQ6PJL0_9BACT|nr:peptide chain release factor N(5)-glutamine methyltransferase [Algoriphagus confluentis]
MPISYLDFSRKLAAQLQLYPESEALNLVDWLLEYHFGLKKVDFLKFMEEKDLPEAFWQDFEKLQSGVPIQYILGKAPFYGRDFLVTPDTLIPRNETEELVYLIKSQNPQSGLRILDVGTGTGCIPITLSLEMKAPEVYGVDISKEALQIAEKNRDLLHAKVSFSQIDILNQTPDLRDLDMIVSNPPYVPLWDKEEMHLNVVDHEPHLALFVPDSDPLIFYRVIGEKGKNLLKKGGRLYFEIYEKAAEEIQSLLEKQGYDRVTIHKDLNGKDRMLSAVKP